MTWPGHVDHWVSFHGEHFPQWISNRHADGLPPAGHVWSAERRIIPPGLGIERVPNWGGSSGLLTVTVALHVGARQAVLAGIPLDYRQGHVYSPHIPWHDAANYRHAWVARQTEMADVRSMSGWTRTLLGEPTREWLDRAVADDQSAGPALEGRQS